MKEKNQSKKSVNTAKEKRGKKETKKNLSTASKKKQISLDDPSLYINREINWLDMNERIFEESFDETNPLLERAKFLAICGGNLDEFFMVRVSGLKRQVLKGALKAPPDGLTPVQQLSEIRIKVKNLTKKYAKCWSEKMIPALEQEGIHITKVSDLDKKQKAIVKKLFKNQIYPTLTPLAMDVAHPFPFISNLSLNLAVTITHPEKGEKYARIKVPARLFNRFVEIPASSPEKKSQTFVLLEDIIISHIDMLFPGLEVTGAYPFRITRNAEIQISFDKASDLLTAVEEGIESRRIGFPVRLQIDDSMPDNLKKVFVQNLGLSNEEVYKFDGPLGLIGLWELLRIDRPELKDKPFIACTPPNLTEDSDIFSALERKDWVFYFPYDNFNVMVHLLHQAAEDPEVLAIKSTMYRIDQRSPLMDGILRARQKGKAASVLVELKAKFDEEKNIGWARVLEEAGVHVVYGLEDLKVHAKILLIVRKRKNKIIRYSLISTGNFNAVTSEIYADISYLTTNPVVGEELTEVFNSLTGYSETEDYKQLIVAPKTLRSEIMKRINREIEQHKKTGNGHIALKLNGLTDKYIIQSLYRASQAGVKVELNVRGLCRLRPGVKGVSENISVISIMGRFLEHARIYYFFNNGAEDVLIGSADMMERNLNRRIEVLLEIPDETRKREIIDHMLKIHLKDTAKARKLQSDGSYIRLGTPKDPKALNSQEWLIKNRGVWHGEEKE